MVKTEIDNENGRKPGAQPDEEKSKCCVEKNEERIEKRNLFTCC